MLGLSIPTLVDGMDNAAGEWFAAWPERLYVAAPEGRITYQGGPGPWGFDPSAAEVALKRLHPKVVAHQQSVVADAASDNVADDGRGQAGRPLRIGFHR